MSSNKIFNKDCKKLRVDIKERKEGYDIFIAANIVNSLPEYISKVYQGKKIFLVSDQNVMNIYGEKIKKLLADADYKVTTYIVPAGEGSKSMEFLIKGYDLMLKEGFRRDNLLLAFGGGVVGDLAGFMAATFMRGIPFVQIPTTLLAQVDSSVGGKTAVNHPTGKNLIGSFYQPDLVLIDPILLATLPMRELKTGLAEVIKHGFIADIELMEFLKNKKEAILNYQVEPLSNIIHSSCLIKSKIVSQDEKEKGKRALLNYGHTIAHALEAVTEYRKYNHGEAVAVGMIGAAEISYHLGLIESSELDYIRDLIKDYGLPLSFQYGEDKNQVYERLYYDKKIKNNKIRWILLQELGEAYIAEDISNNTIKKVLEGLMC